MDNSAVVGVTHTGFTVAKLERASAFFRDVLGFEISPTVRQSGDVVGRMVGIPEAELDIAFATGGGHTIELIQYVRPDGGPLNRRHCDIGYTHLAVMVRDIEAMAARVADAGYRLFSKPQTVPAGPRKGLRNVYAEGPDGIVLELQESPRAV